MSRPEIELPTSHSGNINIKVCQDRFTPSDHPQDITRKIDYSKPFNQHYEETRISRNFLGVPLGTVTIKSGEVYVSVEEGGALAKRLILEIGCSSVIYLLMNSNQANSHRIYIQTIDSFLIDIYTRVLAKRVADVTGPVATFIKFEMNFLMGMFSTVSLGALAAVVGADLTSFFANKTHKIKASYALAQKL